MARRARPAAGADVGSNVDGHPREVWWNADGETVVESYTIAGMAHGTPLGLADNDERYGAEGAFLIEAGISSSYHIANFFGLTERVSQASEAAARGSTAAPAKPSAATASCNRWMSPPRCGRGQQAGPPPKPAPHEPKRRGIDFGGIITRALTAAGLMK